MFRAVGLALLLLVAYAGVRSHGFVYEDAGISRAHAVDETAALHLTSALRPSRWLVAATWSASPQVVHAGNVGIHAINGALVAVLAVQLGLAAWWIPAGIFLLHPIQSQAVAYGVGRGDLLSVFGMLLAAVIAMAAWSPFCGWRRRWRDLQIASALGLLAGGVFALAGKESGVAVIGLLLLLLAYQRRRWSMGTYRWRPSIGTVVAITLLAAIALRGVPVIAEINAYESHGVTAAQWVALESTAVWRLLLLSVWPVGFSIEHDYTHVATGLQLLAIIGLVAIADIAWTLRDRARIVALGLAWVLVAVAPRFLVRIPLAVLPEHQWYGPFVGVSLALGALLAGTPRRSPATGGC